MFTAIGDTTKRTISREESYALVIGFPTTATDLKKGQLVTLGATGEVARVTAATQRPLGPLVSVYEGNDDGNVRVLTPFCMIVEEQNAAAAINTGVALAATGVNGSGTTTYAAAVAGNWVTAVALTTSTGTNTPIAVGILREPYQIPA